MKASAVSYVFIITSLFALSFYSCNKDPVINTLNGDHQTIYSLIDYYDTDTPKVLDQHTELLSVTDSLTGTISVTTMGKKYTLTKIEGEENSYGGWALDFATYTLYYFPANDSIRFTVISIWNLPTEEWVSKE